MYAHRLRWGLTTLCIALALTTATTIATAQTPLPAGLDAGPHAVGFRVITVSDPSRPTIASRARQLRLHVWYPAASGAGDPLTIAGYLATGNQGNAPGVVTAHRQDVTRLLALAPSDDEWAQYLAFGMQARLNAPPVAQRFPLVVGILRPVSVAVGAEHLASHGYVVAYVERQPSEPFAAEGLILEGLILNEHQRDMQLAIARLQDEPNVDAGRLGLAGFATDGLAQLPLAMRHPDVDAVVQFESNWLATGVSSYQKVAAFDPTALRVPLFFAYSENLGRNTLQQVGEIEDMRYASRYLLYFGEPRITPLDFAIEGVVLASIMERRKAARDGVTRVFLATHLYQRRFLDAFVKGDAAARATLETVPVPRSGGAMIELTALPAATPAMTRTALRTLLDANLTDALARAREDLARDPKAQVFDAAWLSALGNDAVIRGQTDRAIAVYTLATEAAPKSAQAFDSLSETLERAGRRGEALTAAEKALAALPGDSSLSAADRQTLSDGLKARIARLKT